MLGSSGAGSWGGPEVTEITLVIWGVLLVLCWHVYAMGAQSFQSNSPKQKVIFALYLCQAMYVSWHAVSFDYLFSIALGVNAFFGLAAGVILSRTPRHFYIVHACALASTFFALAGIYYLRFPSPNRNLLTDSTLLEHLFSPAVLAVFLVYGVIYWVINKCHHLIRFRKAVFISIILIGLPVAVFLINFRRPIDVALIAVSAIIAFAVFIIAAYIERAFIGNTPYTRGIGISLILFLTTMASLITLYYL